MMIKLKCTFLHKSNQINFRYVLSHYLKYKNTCKKQFKFHTFMFVKTSKISGSYNVYMYVCT